MGQSLDKKMEDRLLLSLLETLRSNCDHLVQAYQIGDHAIVKKIGHLLYGNSGALYFHLNHLIEAGKKLEQNSPLSEAEFNQVVKVLRKAIHQLEAIAAEGI